MQKSRSHWTHREPRLTSGLLLRMMIVLIALCLLAQLSGLQQFANGLRQSAGGVVTGQPDS
nr:Uncharacterised protein [Raoultella sp. NCTC 9187]